MLKLIKWLAGLFVTLTVVILLAVIIIPKIVDPNDYRDELSALVKNKTGRDLSVSGDLKISVFPWLGVKIQGLSLSQPKGIEGNMLSVDDAQLRVKLMPLLSNKIEVDTVLLERPIIKLVTL
ncbi:MAG: AsmA protein, partial [Arenicella sp.]